MTRHSRRRKEAVPPAVRALFERARRNDGPSAPRKHHLVPASYLRRWAEDKKIQVTDVNERRSFPSSPENAARVTDYYRVESEDVDPSVVPPLLYETMLSEIEAWGKQAIDELVVRQPWEIDPKLMSYFVWYLAFQYTRGRAYRQMYRDMTANAFRIMYGDMTDQQISARLEKHGRPPTGEAVREMRQMVNKLRNGSLIVQPQDAMIIGHAGQLADKAGEHFLAREWIVYQIPPILVTCDEPVVTIGGPGLPRGERAGIERAGVIIFPLSPSALLVMFRRDIAPYPESAIPELDRSDIAELNHEIISNAARWVFERPGRKAGMAIKVPAYPSQARFDELQTSDANTRIVRFSRPTRWADTENPPSWPVERWWV